MSHIRASYLIIEYIKEQIDTMIAPDTCVFYPGRFATGDSDMSSATYTVVQNLEPQLSSVSTDVITMTIYHQDFDTIQRISSRILNDFNSDHAKDNSVLYARGIDSNIKYHMYISSVTRNDQSTFLEGTEYFLVAINLMHQYVELGGQPSADAVSAYIEGA